MSSEMLDLFIGAFGETLLMVVLILIVFVQLVQSLGDWLVRRLRHR